MDEKIIEDFIYFQYGKLDDMTNSSNKATQLFDKLFVNFIEHYGTHYPTDVDMGGKRYSYMR